VKFEWDETKDISNQRKHGVSFRFATFAFDDPLHVTRQDRLEDDGELRWKTIGLVNRTLLLLVAHTLTDDDGNEEIVRIISARTATASERKSYEND